MVDIRPIFVTHPEATIVSKGKPFCINWNSFLLGWTWTSKSIAGKGRHGEIWKSWIADVSSRIGV
jgi:hypothetical protein